MRIYSKYIIGFSLFLLSLFYYSCSVNNPTKSEEKEFRFSAKQISGCKKGWLGKGVYSDSSFTYSFNDTLKIDFGIWGNCCPDSDRFVSYCKIKSDTIFVTVKDTAKNGCFCNCHYTIHLEVMGLTEEVYLFYMTYPVQYHGTDSLKYREIVKRY